MKKRLTRIPPPLIVLGCALAMYWLNRFLLVGGWGDTALVYLGPAVGLLGITCLAVALTSFKRVGTTVDPINPKRASAMVTEGIFARSRNPMYVGFLSILLGWAIWLGNPLTLSGPLAFFAYISLFQIPREEQAMADKFGAVYEEYRRRVPRWVL